MKEENDTVLAATKDHVALELRTLGFVHSISRSVESVAVNGAVCYENINVNKVKVFKNIRMKSTEICVWLTIDCCNNTSC